MRTTTTSPVDEIGNPPPTGNGAAARPEPLPLAPPRTLRSRVPQALLAGLLIVGGGLGGLLLFSRYNQRTPAVVVVAPVSHGTPLAREDLAVTNVAVDPAVTIVGSISEVVGQYAVADLSPGELLSPTDVATEEQLVSGGESVVGLLLEPGEYPTTRLVAGDRVDVFAPAMAGTPLAADLVVYDVVPSSSDGRTLLVSVVASQAQAGQLFEASSDGGVRLALRGEG
jgi:hypothetical protein